MLKKSITFQVAMARYHNKFCLHLIITSMKSSACIGGDSVVKAKERIAENRGRITAMSQDWK